MILWSALLKMWDRENPWQKHAAGGNADRMALLSPQELVDVVSQPLVQNDAGATRVVH